jgi:hypothetical protein
MNKPGAADTIGRWANEVNTVLTSRGALAQAQAAERSMRQREAAGG